MEVLNRAAIKQEARRFIGEDTRWLKMLLAMLPYLLLSSVVGAGATAYRTVNQITGETTTGYSVSSVSWITILLIPFGIAVSAYFLNCIRGFNPTWKSPYQEGFDRYGKYFTVGFLRYVFIILWSLLLVIPGIVKYYAYSQVEYIIHDNPNLTAKQALDVSKRMTNGFKGQLFVRDLSFILWYLLDAVTFGIATIYVTPYTYTVSAMYYENLKTYAMANGRVAPEEFGILPTPPYADVPPMQDGYPYAQQPPVSGNMGYSVPQQPPVSGDMGYSAPPQPPVSGDIGYSAPQQPPVSEDMDYSAPTNTDPAPKENADLPNGDFTPPAAEDTFRPGTDVPFEPQSDPKQEQ